MQTNINEYELSSDSDDFYHPNIDKRSFREFRRKQKEARREAKALRLKEITARLDYLNSNKNIENSEEIEKLMKEKRRIEFALSCVLREVESRLVVNKSSGSVLFGDTLSCSDQNFSEELQDKIENVPERKSQNLENYFIDSPESKDSHTEKLDENCLEKASQIDQNNGKEENKKNTTRLFQEVQEQKNAKKCISMDRNEEVNEVNSDEVLATKIEISEKNKDLKIEDKENIETEKITTNEEEESPEENIKKEEIDKLYEEYYNYIIFLLENNSLDDFIKFLDNNITLNLETFEEYIFLNLIENIKDNNDEAGFDLARISIYIGQAIIYGKKHLQKIAKGLATDENKKEMLEKEIHNHYFECKKKYHDLKNSNN
ncbi:hypothetical protein EDEG_01056 [Edhazardia aedis USNM 41457]|uniref:Cdc37 N-terminal domain-containing protein n=1 Tax=Edhazardia aedis (strain USNM 41457) TaxID=1003232 RepID=J9DAI9_EDHAE|nr:hypothetical protein EDEG_01056 [Edhazardia aedis USNM 41457]|eukprot:EJW04766.1 hypothetical protein EDEG_01056 [Edhazardia aedis USNM 41457]